MSSELLFWLALLLKMAVTAAFVVAAAMVTERVGPVIGARVATLPIAAGPAPLGTAAGLILAMMVSIAWNLTIWSLRRWRMAASATRL